MIYVDSNIILDLFSDNPIWFEWSGDQLARAGADDRLITGWVVVAEVGHYLQSAEQLRTNLRALGIEPLDADMNAAWLASQAYREYRQRGGERTSLLPDFLIGGHAMATGATLLTRDARRFRSYFPDLELITPEETYD